MTITPAQHPGATSHEIELADEFRARLDRIHARISDACQRSGRPTSDVKLVGVTKTVSVERIGAAIEAGVRLFGENRVQEAAPKIAELAKVSPDVSLRWHFIGHLQSNKARRAVELFETIHSVDSFKLAERLDRAAAELNRRLPIMLEVNLAGEASKSGLSPESLIQTVTQVAGLLQTDLIGLMTVPPYLENAEDVRPYFRRLKQLRDEASSIAGDACLELSMGMSHDYEVAIEEGATFVRIGTALFGSRQQ